MTNPENKALQRQKPKRKFRWLRIIARILLVLLILIILLLLFMRSEWGQNIVVSKVVSYFSEKTQTKVELERAFVTFDGDIAIEGLYLEDKQGDTLVYSRSLEADIPLWPIINGTGIGIENAQWEGVRANIIRKDTLSGFNFDFIAAAFATPPSQQTDTTSTAPMDLIIGDLDLKDFDVVYNDAVTGIDSRYTFKELRISPDTVNLDEMRFTATEGYIENAQIKINQVPVPSDPDAEEIPLPYLAFNKLTLKDVSGNYTGEEAGVSFDFDFKELETSIPKADFNSFVIAINDIVINDSAIGIDMSSTTASQVPIESSNSLFPDYNITVDKASN